jgi:RNase adapter protein RapZ
MGLADRDSSSRLAATIATTVITGCSGAGKSTALKAFEDRGFYCVENLPLFLLADLAAGLAAREDNPRRIAVVTDIRDPAFPQSHADTFAHWRAAARPLTILFLEASEEVLLRRYSQMRRVHPLATGRSLREGLRLEREQLADIRLIADQIIDTSNLTPRDLHRHLLHWIGIREGERDLQISFISFGYKYGPPLEADLLFDVRFLPNPYFVPVLSAKSGLEAEVAGFVIENDDTRRFLDLLRPLLTFLIPQYRREGKAYLTVGIGCTGGRHRSVAMVEELTRSLRAAGEEVRVCHRDLDRS